MAAEGFGVAPSASKAALASFEGVKRRQELLGEPGGVFVYDDFAHHPTAVDETLRALRKKHPKGSLVAIFEPRSATACRNIHQDAYVHAFGAADRVILAPLGRTNIPENERLDLAKLARELGSKARAATSVDDIVKDVGASAKRGDVIAVLSNGAFGGIHALLAHELEKRACAEK
jgi:UDP-N-acetylmuramate: L-alanyl-gamma-D-glutamyl-meso-diaminopimelate ligase